MSETIETIDRDGAIVLLKSCIADRFNGIQKDFAEEVGISQQYLTDILKGRKDLVHVDLLHYLGLERVVVYKKSDQ